jgi:hypothetical protein
MAIGAVTAAGLLLGTGMVKAVAGVQSLVAALNTITGRSITAQGMLAGVGRAAAKFAAIEGGLALVGSLESKSGKAVMSIDAAHAAILQLADTGQTTQSLGRFGNLTENLGKQLHQLTDPDAANIANNFVDTTLGAISFGNVGDLRGGEERVAMLDSLKNIDSALAQMVKSGDAETAQRAFNSLGQAAASQGSSMAQLKVHMTQYRDALAEASAAQDHTAQSGESMAQAVDDNAASAKRAQDQLDQLKDKLDASTNSFLKGRSAEDAYWQSLDSVKQALKENGKTLDVHTAKGRANREALDGMAGASLNYLESLLQQQGPGAAFDKSLTTTRARLVATAEKFGLTRSQAQAYADKVLTIPATVSTKALLDTSQAISALDHYRRMVRDAAGKMTMVLKTDKYGNVTQGTSATRGVTKSAQGGWIPGPPSTADTVPAWLSTGEYVVRAAAVQQVGVGFLDRINTAKYADGGFVAQARAAAMTSTTYGGDSYVFQLDSSVAARTARGFASEVVAAKARADAVRARRRP